MIQGFTSKTPERAREPDKKRKKDGRETRGGGSGNKSAPNRTAPFMYPNSPRSGDNRWTSITRSDPRTPLNIDMPH